MLQIIITILIYSLILTIVTLYKDNSSYLYIADDGNLNGYIIGKDGNATVETIGVGGYNEHVILDSGRHGQCYHFRVLVKPKK